MRELPPRNLALDKEVVEFETANITGIPYLLDFRTKAPDPNMDYSTGDKWDEAYNHHWTGPAVHDPKTPLEEANFVLQALSETLVYSTPALVLYYIVSRL